MAISGKGPAELLEDVFAITGSHFYERVDLELDAGANAAVKAALDASSPGEFAGLPVMGVDTTDGWRFLLSEGWVLFRLSGTEPLLRIYTELAGRVEGGTGDRSGAVARGGRPSLALCERRAAASRKNAIGPTLRTWLTGGTAAYRSRLRSLKRSGARRHRRDP